MVVIVGYDMNTIMKHVAYILSLISIYRFFNFFKTYLIASHTNELKNPSMIGNIPNNSTLT
jgi:hypothetical protein